ncbi:rhomboid-related protein 1 isoform X2 [Lethenteron reissneri]|uniref:rhomboid-related protein 1 isoform X2 n=1 Tax=Lethenteron reissneri TaxID=7753 RepID=UPI002AB69DD1|nr:rhomboid-related protein 1 isoform X2 [Lethenteron reissneri]
MRSRSECDDRRGSVWLPVYVARMAAIETSLLGDPEKENEREEEDLGESRLEAVTVEETQLPISVEDLEPELPGSLSEEALRALLQTRGEELGPAGREALSALLHREEHGAVSYRLFVEALSNKRRASFRCAVSQGLRSDVLEGGIAGSSVGVVGGSAGVGDRCLLSVARETLPRDSERRWFLHMYSGCPPPLLMPSISLAQVVVFVLYGLTLGTWLLPTYDADFMNGSLLYSPTTRHEAWRFISYALTHAGLPGGLGGGQEGPPLGVLGRGLRSSLRPPGQHRHELVEDERFLQSVEDGLPPAAHERRIGPRGVAPSLPEAVACPAQLRAPPGRGVGGPHARSGRAAWLRAAAARPVLLARRVAGVRRIRAARRRVQRGDG